MLKVSDKRVCNNYHSFPRKEKFLVKDVYNKIVLYKKRGCRQQTLFEFLKDEISYGQRTPSPPQPLHEMMRDSEEDERSMMVLARRDVESCGGFGKLSDGGIKSGPEMKPSYAEVSETGFQYRSTRNEASAYKARNQGSSALGLLAQGEAAQAGAKKTHTGARPKEKNPEGKATIREYGIDRKDPKEMNPGKTNWENCTDRKEYDKEKYLDPSDKEQPEKNWPSDSKQSEFQNDAMSASLSSSSSGKSKGQKTKSGSQSEITHFFPKVTNRELNHF